MGKRGEYRSAVVSGTVWRACACVRTHPYREVEYHRHSDVTPIVLSSLQRDNCAAEMGFLLRYTVAYIQRGEKNIYIYVNGADAHALITIGRWIRPGGPERSKSEVDTVCLITDVPNLIKEKCIC